MRQSARSRGNRIDFHLLCPIAFLLASLAAAQSIDPDGKLQIVCPGNVKVRGTAGSNVSYHTKSESRIVFHRQGKVATLQAPEAAAIEVTVPRTLQMVVVQTPGGDLDVADIDGSLMGQAAGRLTIGRVGGNVELRSAGGPINLGPLAGIARCFSGGGAITADWVRGGGLFQTAGGDIVLQKASGQLRAYTGGGSIVASFSSNLPVMDSFLSTAAGDITVVLPSNLRVSIRAQNTGSADLRSIVSDFPVLRVRSLRSAVVAEGAVNGGGPLLRIAGNGGSIYIRKRK